MHTEEETPETGAMDTGVDETGAEAGQAGLFEPATAGEALRAAREAKGLSLEHVSAETRIPVRHLETIEGDHYEELPSRTYAIGFTRNYAKAVGLDEEAIVQQVREEMGATGVRYAALGHDMEPGDPAKLPSSGLVLFGGFAALLLVVGVIAFASTWFGAGEGPAPLVAQVEEEPSAQEAQASVVPAEESAAAAPLSEDGQVVFTALEDGVWVRFYEASGERLFEAQMETGDTFELPASATEPRINTGRPDAFSITIDGREVPKLAEEPVTMGDTPVSAAALLSRTNEG